MTLACIRQAFGLFGTNPCEATVLVVSGAIVGIAVAFAICRMVRPCCKKGGEAAKPCAKKDAKKPYERPVTRHPAPADGSIEIYVGNLSYEMTDDQLRKVFEEYGTVNSARIIMNRYNKSKGFGFVHMPNRAEVDAAVAALNDKDVMGRPIKCNVARNVG